MKVSIHCECQGPSQGEPARVELEGPCQELMAEWIEAVGSCGKAAPNSEATQLDRGCRNCGPECREDA